MEIIISNNSDSPIYEQIKEQIKSEILNGRIKPGEMLPSMRFLAKELRISIITTKRAYEELEREGFIESYTGKGSFVKEFNVEILKESVKCDIEELFEQIIDKSVMADLSYEELMEIFKVIYTERGNCNE